MTTSQNKILATVTGASGLGRSKSTPGCGKQYPSQIEGMLLKGQIWDEGVFEEAVKGVDAVVHAASPADLQIKIDAETDILKPAVAGTLSILESAKNVPSIKSVVVTSSGGAYADIDVYFKPYEEAAKMPAEKAAFVYGASKAAAECAALEFAERPDVRFALSTHVPSFVLGRTFIPSYKTLMTVGLTLSMALKWIWDQKDFSATAALPINTFVSVEDSARSHVAGALNPTISSGHRYLLLSARTSWPQLVRYMIRADPALEPHLPPVLDQPSEDENLVGLYEFDASRDEKDPDYQYTYSTAEELAADFADQVYELAKADGLF
ncbi:hypothetical protein JCM11641_001117 [Rhodosporidiobolus odoratus]